MKSPILLLTTTFLLLLGMMPGCTKEKIKPKPDPLPYPLNELPLPTQEGKGTFGCVINGEPWVAYAPGHLFGRLRAYYDEEHYGLDYNRRFILGSYRIIPSYDLNNDSIASSFGINISPIIGVGYYDLLNLETYKVSFISSKPNPTKTYALDTLAPFHLHITKLDTIKKIMSGTFTMDLRRTIDTTEVLQIRHGRFDAWYQKE